MLTSSNLVAAFGDETTAVLMYDTDTVPVKDAPGAECLTVEDGKITRMRIIFDALPFEAARRARQTTERSHRRPSGEPASGGSAAAGREVLVVLE